MKANEVKKASTGRSWRITGVMDIPPAKESQELSGQPLKPENDMLAMLQCVQVVSGKDPIQKAKVRCFDNL